MVWIDYLLMKVTTIRTVRNVVAQGKTDKLAENDRQKSLKKIRMNCQNLNLEIKGELPLPHGINADDGISKP